MDDLIKYRNLTFIRDLLFCAELDMEPIVGYSLTGGGKIERLKAKENCNFSAHVARCGSTLISQDANRVRSTRVMSGPGLGNHQHSLHEGKRNHIC